jgi:hypothetical protein
VVLLEPRYYLLQKEFIALQVSLDRMSTKEKIAEFDTNIGVIILFNAKPN